MTVFLNGQSSSSFRPLAECNAFLPIHGAASFPRIRCRHAVPERVQVTIALIDVGVHGSCKIRASLSG